MNEEIQLAMKKLNQKASPGIDKVSAKMLYAGREQLMPVLNLFLNKTFSEVKHPRDWSLNFLKTILKKGIASDPDNFRGIAIGSCIAKLFSLVLLGRLEKFVKENELISPNQIGFQKGHRTADHIFVLNSIINKIVKIEKKKLYTAFVDFRKAYDHINRTLLLFKLQKMGIQGLFYENLKQLHNSTLYMIKVEGGYLDPIKSELGLLQGGILSPILFNLYIDDIKEIFDEKCDPVDLHDTKLSHLLYADDLILLSNTEEGLKQNLRNLETYCEKWKLEVNISKTKIIIFNIMGRKIKCNSFSLNGKNIESTNSYCYLGIDMIPSGSYNHCQKVLKEKAQKAMFPLMSAITQFNLSPSTALNLFELYIKPIALYNSENWATLTEHKIDAISRGKSQLIDYALESESDTVVKKFLKFLLGVGKSTSTVAIFGECGQIPFFIHGLLNVLKFWFRIRSLPDNMLVSKAYESQLEGNIQSDWLNTIFFLLRYLGLENRVDEFDACKFEKECKERLWLKFKCEWKTKLKENAKLNLYNQIKHVFEREKYLDDIESFKMRKSITKFRCSNHKLEIEVGRHKGIASDERVCKLCPNEIETESHFLSKCTGYEKLRKKIFGNEKIDYKIQMQ